MNPEWKAKWVAALRSGQYQQGNGALRRVGYDDYCCLGVLCDLIDPNAWTLTYDGAEDDYENNSYVGVREVEQDLENAVFTYRGTTDDAYPPSNVEDVVGMTRSNFETCAEWNDSFEMTFAQIADKIEENF